MNDNKKFTEVFDVSDYEVLTDVGYVDIEKTCKTIEYKIYIIKIGSVIIECADNHIFIDENDNEVYAKDLLNVNVKTENGIEKCLSVIETYQYEEMYDLQLKEHHKYYTNGVLSHNTTVVGGYLLHMAIFNPNYTIACLANKLEQAQEILQRIQESYEGLPWFLQMGVKTWNKRSIHLGNGTKVYVAATSKNAVRGRTLNCLGGNTPITLQDKHSKDTKIITLEQLEKEYGKFYG